MQKQITGESDASVAKDGKDKKSAPVSLSNTPAGKQSGKLEKGRDSAKKDGKGGDESAKNADGKSVALEKSGNKKDAQKKDA